MLLETNFANSALISYAFQWIYSRVHIYLVYNISKSIMPLRVRGGDKYVLNGNMR